MAAGPAYPDGEPSDAIPLGHQFSHHLPYAVVSIDLVPESEVRHLDLPAVRVGRHVSFMFSAMAMVQHEALFHKGHLDVATLHTRWNPFTWYIMWSIMSLPLRPHLLAM